MESLLLQPGPFPARALLNCIIHRRLPTGTQLSARIVETEYYHEADPASHSYQGTRTARNAVMFGPPGHAYVYRSYGIHWCLNCVAAPEGEGCGVLIRAVEPLEGVEEMSKLRSRGQKTAIALHKLGSGPGNVAQALGLDLSFGGMNMLDKTSELWIEQGEPLPEEQIGSSPRIGITRAVDQPWRFFIKGNPSVSGPKVVKAAKVTVKVAKKVKTVTSPKVPKRQRESSNSSDTLVPITDKEETADSKQRRRSARLASRFFADGTP